MVATFDAADRRALASVAVQFFVNGALFASFIPRLPEIRDRLDISVDRVGLLLSLAGLAGLIGSASVGRIIDRVGTRRVLLVAGTALALSLPIVGLARTPLVFLLGLGAMHLFDVLVDVAMNLQGSWLSARRHAPVMSRLHGLWSLGTVVGGLSASRLAAAGVSLPVHLAGAAMVLLFGLVYVGRGLLRVDERHAAEEEPTVAEAVGRRRRVVGGRLGLALLAASGLFAVAIEGTSIDWAAFRFADDLGWSAGQAALGYVAVTGGMTLGRFAGDWAADKLGPARLGRLANLAAGLGLAAATLVDQPLVDLVGFLAAGVGIATMLPAIYDRAARHPGRQGAGLGALTAGLRVAGLAAPVLVGTLAGTSLSVGVAIALVTLPAVVGFAVTGRALAGGPPARAAG